MGIMKKKEAYVTKGTRLIEEKKLPEATEVVVDGLNYYQNKIIKALNGHPVADTALVVAALRNTADMLEKQEPSCRGLVEWLDEKTDETRTAGAEKGQKTRKR